MWKRSNCLLKEGPSTRWRKFFFFLIRPCVPKPPGRGRPVLAEHGQNFPQSHTERQNDHSDPLPSQVSPGCLTFSASVLGHVHLPSDVYNTYCPHTELHVYSNRGDWVSSGCFRVTILFPRGFFFFFLIFIYLFLAPLGLHCFARAGWGQQGLGWCVG